VRCMQLRSDERRPNAVHMQYTYLKHDRWQRLLQEVRPVSTRASLHLGHGVLLQPVRCIIISKLTLSLHSAMNSN
jgi:hypothetical protein